MAAGSPCGSADIEEFRGTVRKILESSGFVGARQLQAFLSYSSEAVFDGRSAIEQVEIAREVLGRGDDFNPLDDPSVRKIASQLRQRLQRYYETEGARDRVVISLPLRSYLPKFEILDRKRSAETSFADADAAEAVGVEPVPASVVPPTLAESETETVSEIAPHYPDVASAPKRTAPPWLLAVVLLIGLGGGYAIHHVTPASRATRGEFHIWTARGDLSNREFGLSKKAVLLGPEVNDHDEAVVRMRFRPTRPSHQAGLLLFSDPDNYVEIGRVFRGRAFLEFSTQIEGRYQKPEAQVHYDPDAQTLAPVWLAIRRNGNEYRGFSSLDGLHWNSFGEVVKLRKPLANLRVGLYAFHGHTSAAPAEAIFDHLSVGPGLHDWPEDTPLEGIFGAGWQGDKTCHAVGSLIPENLGVRFTGLSMGRPCTGEIVRPVPAGDWSLSTRIDFVPADGLLTGIQVRGPKGRFRVVRWNINGGTISAEKVHSEQANVPDFSGSPPIILRIDCNRGVMEASFSRDDVEYIKLPLKVELSSLGASPVIGYQLGRIGWLPGADLTPLVYWLHQEVTQTHPLD